MRRTPTQAWRALGVALAGACCCVLAVVAFVRIGLSSWALASGPAAASPDDVLLALVALLGALLTVWLAIATALAALAQVPGAIGAACSRWADSVAPAVVRRVVALAIGSALVTAALPGTAAAFASAPGTRHTAAATLDRPPDPTFRPLTETTAETTAEPTAETTAETTAKPTTEPDSLLPPPDPGFVPLAPRAPVATSTSIDTLEHSPRQLPETDEVHVVRRGDTLWDIAAARLGPGATLADIAASWPRWYAANRRLIGPDPSHIVPGLRLVPPRDGALAGAPAAVLTSPGASR
jgi:nucleoid-associated protein YgaU